MIRFFSGKSQQNEFFDGLYAAGHQHQAEALHPAQHQAESSAERAYAGCVERAKPFLEACGFDAGTPVHNLSILDVACGSGWITAGLYTNPNIVDCLFHAFDISSEDVERLGAFVSGVQSANRLEMSVQAAQDMKFADASFDVILGVSVLHHFDDYEAFLADCRRILKPNGVAAFAEPFAIGYALAAAALKLAQRQTG